MQKSYTIARYMRETGLSRKAIKNMIEAGDLKARNTSTGGEREQWRIIVEENTEIAELNNRLDVLGQLISKMCLHLGVDVEKLI